MKSSYVIGAPRALESGRLVLEVGPGLLQRQLSKDLGPFWLRDDQPVPIVPIREFQNLDASYARKPSLKVFSDG